MIRFDTTPRTLALHGSQVWFARANGDRCAGPATALAPC
jgi:hypothetical protein